MLSNNRCEHQNSTSCWTCQYANVLQPNSVNTKSSQLRRYFVAASLANVTRHQTMFSLPVQSQLVSGHLLTFLGHFFKVTMSPVQKVLHHMLPNY